MKTVSCFGYFLEEQGKDSPRTFWKTPEFHWLKLGHTTIPEPITDTWGSFLSWVESWLLWYHISHVRGGGMSQIKLGSAGRGHWVGNPPRTHKAGTECLTHTVRCFLSSGWEYEMVQALGKCLGEEPQWTWPATTGCECALISPKISKEKH